MAYFQPALDKTLAHEGGFVNDPKDPGGMTFCGISRKAWPDWDGWEVIDERLISGAPLDTGGMRNLVYVFYNDNFWLPLHGDEIASQEIANYLFDFAANSGISDAVKALQRALNFYFEPPKGVEFVHKLEVDGVIGEKTLNMLSDAGEFDAFDFLLLSMRAYRLAHYIETIADNPKLARFARGWARRALA